MKPADEPTLPPAALTGELDRHALPDVVALVVLWSRHEPHRVGEVMLVPDDGADAPWIFGRGEASPGERRLILLRQRPGRSEAVPAVESPRISRAQLAVTARGDGIAVTCAGRCPMAVGDREVEEALLAPGDILELRNEMLLMCTARPLVLPALPSGERAAHRFGEADSWGFVGESLAAWRLRATVADAARRSGHVLVLGPSGAGKELVALALHEQSPRGGRPLCARNAATIPEGLADAELFGNLKSYPNPGTPERPGLIGQADGSSLLLDEIAELPVALQAHLLRVLDRGEYQRLGEAVMRRADFRLIGATNRPEASLKHDVLARFTLRLHVPGLPSRREDVPLIAAHLLRRRAALEPGLAERFFGGAQPRLAPALVAALVRHPYTTHVRELEGLLVIALLESTGKYVDLTEGVRKRLDVRAESTADPAAEGAFSAEELRRLALQRAHGFRATDCGRDPEYRGNRQTADLHLRQLLCRALLAGGWDVDAAAGILAGHDEELKRRARTRIETFLVNLERRLADAPSSEARRHALADQWRGDPAAVSPVIEALLDGRIRGRSPG